MGQEQRVETFHITIINIALSCYLNSLPRKFMRTMAGHTSQMGFFEIHRARVAPPDVLLSMIWPGLDIWKDRFGPQTEAGEINDL